MRGDVQAAAVLRGSLVRLEDVLPARKVRERDLPRARARRALGCGDEAHRRAPLGQGCAAPSSPSPRRPSAVPRRVAVEPWTCGISITMNGRSVGRDLRRRATRWCRSGLGVGVAVGVGVGVTVGVGGSDVAVGLGLVAGSGSSSSPSPGMTMNPTTTAATAAAASVGHNQPGRARSSAGWLAWARICSRPFGSGLIVAASSCSTRRSRSSSSRSSWLVMELAPTSAEARTARARHGS